MTFEFKGTFRDLVKKYLRIDLEICTVQMKYEVEEIKTLRYQEHIYVCVYISLSLL